jgi:Hemerythrin HHE cation binding domain
MKRPALIPLSRDHHDGLVQAVRPRRAAADGDASARLVAAREFVEFFRNEERVHLRGEEEELFPLFLRHKTAELGRRHRLFLDATRIDANQPAVPDVKPIQDEFRSAAKGGARLHETTGGHGRASWRRCSSRRCLPSCPGWLLRDPSRPLRPYGESAQPIDGSRDVTLASGDFSSTSLRNAEVGRYDGGISARLVGRRRRDDFAEVEDNDVVADAHHQAHVVLDEEHTDPPSSTSRRSNLSTSAVSCEERPAVGSSRSRIDGCTAMARANATRRRCPYERSITRVSRRSVRPNSRIAAATSAAPGSRPG